MSLYEVPVPDWLTRPERGFLSEAETAALDVLFARILPEDRERGIPGAVRCGASRFVSLLLARDDAVYREISAWRGLYREGLAALERHARSRGKSGLAAMDEAEVDDLLRALEAGTFEGLPPTVPPKDLFTALRRHCIQGCFADPRWGGNADGVMWRAIGYLKPAEDVFRG